MSSILDALNKLEEEKAQAEVDPDDIAVDVDDARYDLVGRSVMQDRVEVRVKPATLAVALSGFAIALVVVSVLVSMAVLRGGGSQTPEADLETAGPTVVAAVVSGESAHSSEVAVHTSGEVSVMDAGGAVAPTEGPVVRPEVIAAWSAESPQSEGNNRGVVSETMGPIVAPPKVEPITSVEELPPPAEQPVAVTPEVKVAAAGSSASEVVESGFAEPPAAMESEPPAAMESEAPVAVVSEAPAPAVSEAPAPTVLASNSDAQTLAARVEAARARLRADMLSRTQADEPAPEPVHEEISLEDSGGGDAAPERVISRELPVLSPSAMARHNLGDLMVNIVAPATDLNPVGSAVINRLKVFENERINGTKAKLLQVEANGVVLEITGTGERYFLPQ